MPAPTFTLHSQNPQLAQAIADGAQIHPYLAQILINRGITSPESALAFLRSDAKAMLHPLDLPGMPRTIALLQELIAHEEPILVFGDSDCDGVLSSLILYETLQACGAQVQIKLADRISLGYGLSDQVLNEIVASHVRCVILIDCGTNQHEAMQTLRAHGIESIVLDHHVPTDGLPQASAWINPHCVDGAPGRELCSTGLAYKTAQALCPDREDLLKEFLILAAIGTLADCSPLIAESRCLVKQGLAVMPETGRGGLLKLMRSVGFKKVTPDTVLKKLVPRINAMGRLGDATAIWQLLHQAEPAHQETWFEKVLHGHESLKQMSKRIAAQAMEQVNRLHFKDQHILIVGREGWHAGLMGPLAAQLAARYNRPAIAVALGEQTGTGSARSIPSVNLLSLLQECESHLLKFGGHAQACGLTVAKESFQVFQQELNGRAKEVIRNRPREASGPLPCDLEVGCEDITPNWVQELKHLQPLGMGNPPPRILLRNVWIKNRSPRRGWVGNDFFKLPLKGTLPPSQETDRFDLAVNPVWEGKEVKLQLLELKPCAVCVG